MKKLIIPRLEIEVDMDKLQNPKLKRIFVKREKDFLFRYGDHDDHSAYADRYYDKKHTDNQYGDDGHTEGDPDF